MARRLLEALCAVVLEESLRIFLPSLLPYAWLLILSLLTLELLKIRAIAPRLAYVHTKFRGRNRFYFYAIVALLGVTLLSLYWWGIGKTFAAVEKRKKRDSEPTVQRTVVQVDSVYMMVNPDGSEVVARVIFRNKGPEVATGLVGFVQPLFFGGRNADQESIVFRLMEQGAFKPAYPYTEGPSLGIDETREFAGITPNRLTKEQVKQWQAGGLYLYVMGEARYRDSHGELQTELCWIMTPPPTFKTDISSPWVAELHGFCASGQNNVIAARAEHGPEH